MLKLIPQFTHDGIFKEIYMTKATQIHRNTAGVKRDTENGVSSAGFVMKNEKGLWHAPCYQMIEASDTELLEVASPDGISTS